MQRPVPRQPPHTVLLFVCLLYTDTHTQHAQSPHTAQHRPAGSIAWQVVPRGRALVRCRRLSRVSCLSSALTLTDGGARSHSAPRRASPACALLLATALRRRASRIPLSHRYSCPLSLHSHGSLSCVGVARRTWRGLARHFRAAHTPGTHTHTHQPSVWAGPSGQGLGARPRARDDDAHPAAPTGEPCPRGSPAPTGEPCPRGSPAPTGALPRREPCHANASARTHRPSQTPSCSSVLSPSGCAPWPLMPRRAARAARSSRVAS